MLPDRNSSQQSLPRHTADDGKTPPLVACPACSVLGQGVLGALQSAAIAGLLSPQVVCVPEAVTVKARLVNTLLTEPVSGFDLSPVNRYKWHPTIEHIEHDR